MALPIIPVLLTAGAVYLAYKFFEDEDAKDEDDQPRRPGCSGCPPPPPPGCSPLDLD